MPNTFVLPSLQMSDALVNRLLTKLPDDHFSLGRLLVPLYARRGDILRIRTQRGTYYFLEIISLFPLRAHLFRVTNGAGAGYRKQITLPFLLQLGGYFYVNSFSPIEEIVLFKRKRVLALA